MEKKGVEYMGNSGEKWWILALEIEYGKQKFVLSIVFVGILPIYLGALTITFPGGNENLIRDKNTVWLMTFFVRNGPLIVADRGGFHSEPFLRVIDVVLSHLLSWTAQYN